MIAVLKASDLPQWLDSQADVLVICDVDADSAAEAQRSAGARRTAIFIGDLDDDAERQAAKEFACETFNVGPNEVAISLPE